MGLGSGIRDPGSGKNLFWIPDPGVKKAPATLHTARPFCWWWKVLHTARPDSCFRCYSCFILKNHRYKCRNVREKLSKASAVLPAVNFFSPAPAFRQGQSGTAGHGLVRHCPAMLFPMPSLPSFLGA
jgi:hypothetical protein